MVSFIQFLDELNQSEQAAVLPAGDVERLVRRFGPGVRSMGFWNKTGDGSLKVPMANIAQAARLLEDGSLAQAVEQLKSPDQFAHLLNRSSAAARLIETLSGLYLEQFERHVERLQNSADPAEVERLRQDISRELFGD